MAHKQLILALSVIAAASPAIASNPELTGAGAPSGTENTRYCLRVEAVTGSRIETIECWTRREWAEQGVDVDEEWAEEGVRVIA